MCAKKGREDEDEAMDRSDERRRAEEGSAMVVVFVTGGGKRKRCDWLRVTGLGSFTARD